MVYIRHISYLCNLIVSKQLPFWEDLLSLSVFFVILQHHGTKVSNSYSQQFHQHQQTEKSPLTSTHFKHTQKRIR